MGIHDRDYIRNQSPPGGRLGGGPGMGIGGWRLWSVNTWLIAICVGVYVIDALAGGRWVQMETVLHEDVAAAVTVDQLVFGDMPDNAQRTGVLGRPVFVQTSNGLVQVGAQRLQWMHWLESFGHFSTQRGFLELQLWRIITFQFLHDHGMFAHLLFNMIGLYFFGPIVERHLGGKRYLAFYLLCGIFGALMYTLLNVLGIAAGAWFGVDRIPGLLFNNLSTPLIGASAGVFGVLMAGAYLVPNAIVLLFFIIPMRLAMLAWGLLIFAFLNLLFGAPNAGGEAGHLGGAIAGFYFIRHPHHLHGFFDILGRVDPTSHHYRSGKPVRPVQGRARAGSTAEIDRVLDKIHREGLQSLTDKEKRVLRESSRK